MSPSTPAKLKTILNGVKDGTFISPETKAFEDRFNFTGGNLTTVFSDMKDLFDAMKVRNDGTLDEDNDSNTWTTTVVVYDYSELPSGKECANPGQGVNPLIVGFATVTITNVLVTPEKTIEGRVQCYQTVPGRGSGGNYGNRGSIPGLVE